MPRALTGRAARVCLLLLVAVVGAAGLVLVGGGSQRQAGAAVSPGTTRLVSVGGEDPFSISVEPSISADGRYIAFATARSLDPLDLPRRGDSDLDVYVRDMQREITVLLSHGIAAPLESAFDSPELITAPANGASLSPSISADGRYVAFQTRATNLGPEDDDDVLDVVVVDRDPDGDGVLDETDCRLRRLHCHEFTRISPDHSDDQERPIGDATAPSISAGGDAIAWVGAAAEGSPRDVWVYRSRLTLGRTGAITDVSSHRVVGVAEGLDVRAERAPALSGDGTRVVFGATVRPEPGAEGPPEVEAPPTEAPPGEGETTGLRTAVLGVDFTTGPLPESVERYPAVRLDVDGEGRPLDMPENWDPAPTISFDGRQIAFCALGADSHVVLAVRWDTEPPRSELVSADVEGNPVNGSDPALSANGRYIAFTTWARNTHNGVDGPDPACDPVDREPPGEWVPRAAQEVDPEADDASHCDVVVRDLEQDRARAADGLPRLPAELASPSLSRECVEDLGPEETCEGDEASRNPVLSAEGGVVAYESQAETLVAVDPNGTITDVFARTFTPRLVGDPLDFFTVEPGNSTLGTAELRHEGFGPLVVNTMTVGGPNGADFTLTAQTCIDRTLHAGETCLATLRFSPSELGRREGLLDVAYRGLASPLLLPLTGVGDLDPERAVTIEPEPVDFGEHLPLSANPPLPVTVTNTGAAPLIIDAVSLPTDTGPGTHPEDYAIGADGCTGRTLPPGESCVVSVRHSPQGVGARPAILRFDDNAPNGPHLVSVRGAGIQPTLLFDPAVVTVGRVTTVFGAGFAPDRPVFISLRGHPETITVVADGLGAFAAPLVIFPNAVAGERIADATIVDSAPPITATATFLAVPGTISPPEFVTRR